ncbi:hypothetical protein N7532_008790 [Penicillium argentinense]|uniref:Uncharacterized protein n=1 Tax=Penicillium argentinense TaxID=1131581 RepID=A0A9W9K2D2_9EURO|nr:uncharacterized protein N7532_008790 [Penicillium argentinense]KAJ5090106.1 hypothetical protein N7532_008790 [Penicillium argentinense]
MQSSGLFPTVLPSPPDSPRKRRRLLRESEDNEGEMTLEAYLVRSDPYRSNTQANPWPLPLDGEHAPQIEHQILDLSDVIQQILSSHGFPENLPLRVCTVRKPEYPGGNVPINMLRVILTQDDYTPISFGPAKDAIRTLLRDRQIFDVHVEIINIDLCFNPSLFTISEDDPIVAAFVSTEEQIIAILHRGLRSKWRVLCPFNVGRSRREACPTIVVYVDPCTSANWLGLGSEIKSAISQYGVDHDVDVEFLPGRLSFLQNRGVSLANRIDANGRLAMGHSIGIHTEQNAGTLGGYFTLEQNGKVHKGFLTAYHVVRPSDSPSGGNTSFLADLDRSGCSFETPPAEDIQVSGVARIDRDESLKNIERHVAALKGRVEALSNRLAEREMLGKEPLPAQQQMLSQAAELISELNSKHDLFERMPQVMGKVVAASGKAVLGRRIMDWAFVELTEEAADKFFGPNVMPALPSESQSSLDLDDHNFALPYPEGEPLREFGKLEKGKYYLKLGRTTGLTMGQCNGALARCRWSSGVQTRYDPNSTPVTLSDNYTQEFVILSVRPDGSAAIQDDFVLEGDSGSLVLDVDGKVCGVLYGGIWAIDGASAYSGLVVDMTELVSSIKMKTKIDCMPPAELSLPQRH